MKGKRTEEKPQEMHVMPNTLAPHLLRPSPSPAVIRPSYPISPVYTLPMTFYAMEYPFDQFRSPVLAIPTSSLYSSSLAEHQTL